AAVEPFHACLLLWVEISGERYIASRHSINASRHRLEWLTRHRGGQKGGSRDKTRYGIRGCAHPRSNRRACPGQVGEKGAAGIDPPDHRKRQGEGLRSDVQG